MKLRKMFEFFGEKLGAKATARAVYGKPVRAGDCVVIPVAHVSFGFGGSKEPAGGGGGLEVRPVGVIEVTPQGTRFLSIGGPRLIMEDVVPGILRFQEGERSCMVMHAGGEAAIIDLPPGADFALPLSERLQSAGLTVRWLCVTSATYARSGGLVDFRGAFPQARVVSHRALMDDPTFARQAARRTEAEWPGDDGHALVDEAFEQPMWQGEVGGEPFIVLHAPQGTPTDQMVVFRGCLALGDLGPAENGETPQARQTERLKVAEQLTGTAYRIHTVIPSQGAARAASSQGSNPSGTPLG